MYGVIYVVILCNSLLFLLHLCLCMYLCIWFDYNVKIIFCDVNLQKSILIKNLYAQSIYMVFSLCSYRYIIGKPNEGVHRYRFMGIAIFDVAFVIVVAFLLHFFFHFHFIYTLLILFLLGILFHRLFCVRTTVDRWLFP